MFLNPEHIFIITHTDMIICLPTLIKKDKRCIILDENEICESVSFNSINDTLNKFNFDYPRTGWYLQQFIKMGFAMSKYCQNEYYLSWDADTLPLKHIDFFSGKDKPLFSMKTERHEPYFETIKKLFGFMNINEHSYIAEHMMFNKAIMVNLVNDINNNCHLKGSTWVDKILSSCNNTEMCAFSEFETYGNYCLNKYPDLYVERQLPSFRCGGLIMGRFINDRILKELSFDLYTASFEMYHQPPFPWSIMTWLYTKYVKTIKYKEYSLHQKIKSVKDKLFHH